ncbi:MAG: RidA family protein [Terriglobales bacterium]
MSPRQYNRRFCVCFRACSFRSQRIPVPGQDRPRVDVEAGKCAAQSAVLGCLASLQHALSSLDKVCQIVKLNGYVNCTPEFHDLPLITDAASTLLVGIFGDSGRHARTTVGVSSLPADVAVEIELIARLESRQPLG